jgi:flavin-dependent dehydrogenase
VRGRLEVAVVGGGPAGCLTAILLARRGCRVAIFDKSRPDAICIGETLPPQASRLLCDVGLFDRFRNQGHRASPGIVSAWGNPEPRVTDFIFSPGGDGWHLDRRKFNALFREAAVEAGASFFPNTSVRACIRFSSASDWTIRTGDGGEFKCDVLVDASGRHPPRNFPYRARTVYDHLIAIAGITDVADSRTVSDYTLIESVEEGWFYSACLPCGKYILTFMTDADLYAVGRARSTTYLNEQLHNAPLTNSRISHFPPATASLSAATVRRTSVVQSNWMAVGDAARSYDPLSGLGLLNSMKSAIEATPVILDMLTGQTAAAVRYEAGNRRSFCKYWQMYASYYSLERRWLDSPFWARRQVRQVQSLALC